MLAAGGAAYAFLHASLPTLDGTLATPGLASSVTITRDAAGVPTLRAANRTDLAYAIGFVHAQDRFFQMDLLRRAGSGELAGLLGPRLLPVDRERRIHRFAARATAAVAAMSADDKVLLDRYVSGVNAGLAALGARPFEYGVLRATPRPWRPEDTLLVIWTMYFDLQDDQLRRVYSRGWLRDHDTSPEQLAFLLPTATAYDAPLDAPRIDEPAPALPASAPAWFGKPAAGTKVAAAAVPEADLLPPADTVFGSNNWAVSGARSATGAAIVSVDMHLTLRLPHIWHRAVIEITAPPGGVPAARRLAGVMLPGAPAIVAGSNGHVAWGFTNSYGHYLELLELERDPQDATRYRTAAGWAPFKYTDERIEVAGAATETLTVAETLWGPVWERGGKSYAVRWVAHDPGAVDFKLGEIDAVTTVAEALALGQRSGVPAQNMVAGDAAGHIGWTVAGAIPGRTSTWATTLPYPAASASAPGWAALAAPASHPSIIDPPAQQLWTANSRQLAGPDYERIGDGGADLGARALQARDDVTALGARTDEAGLYGVALDDRALYLTPWRERALKAMAGSASDAAHPQRAEFARLLQSTWSGRASIDSVAYRLTRSYYNALYRQLFGGVDDAMHAADKQASFARATARWPAVIARLLDEQPAGWLPPGRADWQAVQLAAIDDAIAEIGKDGTPLAQATWGKRNTTRIAHPMAASLPWGMRWLAAPAEPLPGDSQMPRVAAPEFGQSERMVISPGHEDRALFNMPGGQSGHPLSPWFLAGHADWVQGRPTPLLPSARAHELTLVPLARP